MQGVQTLQRLARFLSAVDLRAQSGLYQIPQESCGRSALPNDSLEITLSSAPVRRRADLAAHRLYPRCRNVVVVAPAFAGRALGAFPGYAFAFGPQPASVLYLSSALLP